MMTVPDDQVLAAYQQLPKSVREYLSGTELFDTVTELGTKYSLHVDVIGELSRSTTYMVLGFLSPVALAAELKALGIPEAAVQALIADINQKIFMPLQQKMRETPEPEESEEDFSDLDIPASVPAAPQSSMATSPVSMPASRPLEPSMMPPPKENLDKDSPVTALQAADSAFREKIIAAHQRATPEVRALLVNPAVTQAVRSIRTGHKIPPEVAVELGSKVGQLLLGVIAPVELRNQLLLAGTAIETAEKVVQEIQAKIVARVPGAVSVAAIPPAPNMPISSSGPASVPAPAAVQSASQPQPVAPVPRMPAAAPVARTMAADMQALMHPEMASPARSFQTGSVPSTMPPIVPASALPPAQPVAVAPQTPPVPTVPAPHSAWQPAPATDAPRGAGIPIVKEYGADPYRELPQ